MHMASLNAPKLLGNGVFGMTLNVVGWIAGLLSMNIGLQAEAHSPNVEGGLSLLSFRLYISAIFGPILTQLFLKKSKFSYMHPI